MNAVPSRVEQADSHHRLSDPSARCARRGPARWRYCRLALMALLAAPTVFDIRQDAPRLGSIGLWGFSCLQAAIK